MLEICADRIVGRENYCVCGGAWQRADYAGVLGGSLELVRDRRLTTRAELYVLLLFWLVLSRCTGEIFVCTSIDAPEKAGGMCFARAGSLFPYYLVGPSES